MRRSPGIIRVLAFSTATVLAGGLGGTACSTGGMSDQQNTSATTTLATVSTQKSAHAWLLRPQVDGSLSFTTNKPGESGKFSCAPGQPNVMSVELKNKIYEKTGLIYKEGVCLDNKVEPKELEAEILYEVTDTLAAMPQ